MREILFRGKRLNNGEWVQGDFIQLHDERKYVVNNKFGACIDNKGNFINTEAPFVCEVDPATVGQYTGSRDKNGKKIFEGDIISFDYVGKNLGVDGIEAVIFENGKFGVKWGWHSEFVCLDGFANTTLEVIGNTYDNPERLVNEEE